MQRDPETETMMTPADMLGAYGSLFGTVLRPGQIADTIDSAIGYEVVPKYQWYDTGGRKQISGDEVAYLEDIFFNGEHHGYGDLELHRDRYGRCLLRVRNGFNRVLMITVAEKPWLLVGYHHYDKGRERSGTFIHELD